MKRMMPRFALALCLACAFCLLCGCASREAPPPADVPQITDEPLSSAQPTPQAAPAAPAAPQGEVPSVSGNSVPAAPQGGSVQVQQGFSSGITQDADLRIALVAVNGVGFNPYTSNARDINSLLKLVFESVVELDDNLQPTALLASGWTCEDGVYLFTLREGVRFHNGAELTAYDVYASYEAIQIAGSFSPYFARIQYIRSMTVVDEHTLQVEGQDCGYLTLYAMTFPVASQLSVSSELPRGTGPYWFVATDANGNVRLERNPIWWKKQAGLQAVAGVRYDTDAEALTALETHEVDCVATRSSTGALYRQLNDLSTIDYSTLTWECLVPNLSHSILGDEAVRKAILFAIDRSSLAANAYLGLAQESEVPVIPGSFLYEPQSTQYNYNPERALQILYEAGWQDTNGDGVLDRIKDGLWEDLAFEITTYDEPGSSIRSEALEAVCQQLNRIGFHATCKTVSKTRMSTNLDKGDFELALIAYNLSEVPNLEFMLSGRGKGNYSGSQSDRMDELLTRARSSEDESSFVSAMSDVQMLVVSDLPVMGLFFRTGVLISERSLGGLSGCRESQLLRGIQYVAG